MSPEPARAARRRRLVRLVLVATAVAAVPVTGRAQMLSDDTLRTFGAVILSVLGALGIGAGGRSWLTRNKRDRTKDEAETDYFQRAIGEVTLERDTWRSDSTRAWERVRKLEQEKAMLMARNTFLSAQLAMVRRLQTLYPEIATFIPSDLAPFDELGPERAPPPPAAYPSTDEETR